MAANRYAIKDFRTLHGLSLRAMEQQTGISRGFLSQIETGERGASDATLARIATALRIGVKSIKANPDGDDAEREAAS